MLRFPVFAPVLLLVLLATAAQGAGGSGQPGAAGIELLPPQQAFRLGGGAAGERVRVRFDIAEGYYLYRDRISIKPAGKDPGLELGAWRKPPGISKRDPLFGLVQTYRRQVIFELPLASTPVDGLVRLEVSSQGCADIGVCFPPQIQPLKIALNTTAARPGALERLGQLFGGQRVAAGGGGEFPPPDEVFQVDALALDAATALVRFQISDGYYLYRQRLHFSLGGPGGGTLAAVELPPGEPKQDPYFGAMQVYHQGLEVPLAIQGRQPGPLNLRVEYQGCAEAGLCYPPQSKLLRVDLPAAGSARPLTGPQPGPGPQGELSETDQLARGLVEGSLVFMLASFFGWGLLLAFTPCVLPMVPILATIIAGQGQRLGGRRGFGLASVYVLAMALTYTGAGISAALLGQNLQALFQQPLVLIGFSGIFIVLALAMFGVYELQLPASWQSRIQQWSQAQRGGRYGGVAIMGSLSALIVGPCVAAPLAAALIVIGGSGDPLRGGLALFALSLGMGMPLLAVGAFGDRIMPKAGPWMILVKQLFGLMLLAVAVYLLSRILPAAVVMGLWSALMLLTALLLALRVGPGDHPPAALRLRQGLGALALVYAGLLGVGAASGAADPLNPLARVFGDERPSLAFTRVANLGEFDRLVREAGRRGQPVMLDLYADWCVTCKQLEAETFSDPGVRQALAQTLTLQADVTAYNADDKALLARYGLLGPPAILFFDTRGQEIRARRVIGFMDAGRFRQTLSRVLGS